MKGKTEKKNVYVNDEDKEIILKYSQLKKIKKVMKKGVILVMVRNTIAVTTIKISQ